jgi:ribonuclease HI
VPTRLKIFFDGGCRPNPGPIEIAVVFAGRTEILRDVGTGTSADAEWLALLHAVEVAQALGRADYVLLGDSANIVTQANGLIPCRGDAARHLQAFRALTADTGPPRIRRVKRTQNLAGIALAALRSR